MTNKCIVCNGSNTDSVLDILQAPVYCNVLWPSRIEALNVSKGDIQLFYCNDCDHLFNDSFDPNIVDYNASYDASLHYSPKFQSFADELAEKLCRKMSLDGKTVVEIACGKGDFLSLIGEKSSAKLLGFDPSYDGRQKESARFTIISEYYGKQHQEHQADAIICRHALEHLEKPTEFLRQLTPALTKYKRVELYFEMPNSLFMLRDLSVWDFIYEHISYFSPASLHECFSRAGYGISDCYESYAGQFLSIEAFTGETTSTGETVSTSETISTSETASTARKLQAKPFIASLVDHYKSKISYWRKELQSSNAKVVLWGAGSKGVTFLNGVSCDSVKYIVDLNPNKQGKFIPGTGQQVIGPEQLTHVKPDQVIIMNPIYQQEIETMLSELGIGAKVRVV